MQPIPSNKRGSDAPPSSSTHKAKQAKTDTSVDLTPVQATIATVRDLARRTVSENNSRRHIAQWQTECKRIDAQVQFSRQLFDVVIRYVTNNATVLSPLPPPALPASPPRTPVGGNYNRIHNMNGLKEALTQLQARLGACNHPIVGAKDIQYFTHLKECEAAFLHKCAKKMGEKIPLLNQLAVPPTISDSDEPERWDRFSFPLIEEIRKFSQNDELKGLCDISENALTQDATAMRWYRVFATKLSSYREMHQDHVSAYLKAKGHRIFSAASAKEHLKKTNERSKEQMAMQKLNPLWKQATSLPKLHFLKPQFNDFESTVGAGAKESILKNGQSQINRTISVDLIVVVNNVQVKIPLLAIIHGQEGIKAAEHCQAHLPALLVKHLKAGDSTTITAETICNAGRKACIELQKTYPGNGRTTLTFALIYNEGVYTFCVGGGRALIIGDKTYPLTCNTDRKMDSLGIHVTRFIGNIGNNEEGQYVRYDPRISCFTLPSDRKDNFYLILMSNSLTNLASDLQIGHLIQNLDKQGTIVSGICHAICSHAVKVSSDCISVVLLKLGSP